MHGRARPLTMSLRGWMAPSHTIAPQGGDPVVYLATMLLAVIGVIMVFSASAVVADARFQDTGYFLKRQVAWVVAGMVLLHLASRIDYSVWRRFAWPALGACLVLLALVLVPLMRGRKRRQEC